MKQYTDLVDDAIGELVLVTGSKWSADLDVQRIGKYEAGMNNRDLLSQFRSDAIFNGYRRQEELKTQIDSLNAEWADPVSKFKSVVGWHSGMRHHPVNGFTTDERGVRAFLFGMGPMSALGDRAFSVLGDFVPQEARTAAIVARCCRRRYSVC